MLRANGVNIISTGGETADLGDLVRTVVCDSTVTCRMRRDEVISNDRIRPGDVIVGMASYGKATYETEYNGGMGSNGLTSARCVAGARAVAGWRRGQTAVAGHDQARCSTSLQPLWSPAPPRPPAPSPWLRSRRHDVFNKVYADKYPESFDPAVPRDLIFSGKYKLTDVEPETGVTVGKLVLSPTRTYAPIIKKLLQVRQTMAAVALAGSPYP